MDVMNVLGIKTFRLAFLLAMILLSAQRLSAEPRSYVARAYDLDTGRLLYSEHHEEIWAEDSLVAGVVEYKDPDGQGFARKELFFGRSLFAPAVKMVDARDGFEEGAEWGESGLRLFARSDDRVRGAVVESVPDDAVIDAGFHRFMQAQLPRLVAGERTDFSFAVPSYGRFFRFKVAIESSSEDSVRLAMKPANAFLRLLVDPVFLEYDRRGRLLVFEGMTNIPDADGERHLARIVFEYPETFAAQVATAG